MEKKELVFQVFKHNFFLIVFQVFEPLFSKKKKSYFLQDFLFLNPLFGIFQKIGSYNFERVKILLVPFLASCWYIKWWPMNIGVER